MSDVARYTAAGDGVVRLDDEGPLVVWQDYARLKAEVERLDTLCKQLGKQHSDISCENIMLRKAGDAVVADLEYLTKSGWFNKCKSVKKWNAAKEGKGQP